MGSPSAQKDDNMRLEIVCAVVQEVIKENNQKEENKKPGEYTVVESKGRKDDVEAQIAQSLEQVIQAGAIDNECKFDAKTNTMLRVVNSKEIIVRDKNSFKKAYKEMKEKGKTYAKDNLDKNYGLDEK